MGENMRRENDYWEPPPDDPFVRPYNFDKFTEKPDERKPVMDVNEELVYRVLMVAFAVIAICGAVGAVTAIVWGATETSFMMMGGGVLAAAFSAGSGAGSVYFAQRATGHERVFANPVEREVLTRKQRHELRSARGGLVFQQAMYKIEDERDNMITRQIEGPPSNRME